jgi:hypothetical protein
MSFAEAKRKKKIIDKLTWYFNGMLQNVDVAKECDSPVKFFCNRFFQRKIFRMSAIIPNAIVQIIFDIPAKSGMSNTLLYMGVIDNNKNLYSCSRQ